MFSFWVCKQVMDVAPTPTNSISATINRITALVAPVVAALRKLVLTFYTVRKS